jgi:DNA-directed RNA polymerase specialized sigma24 family protein
MTQLQDQYEMSQAKVAEALFLKANTVGNIERRALEKLKKLLEERGISAKDLLGGFDERK